MAWADDIGDLQGELYADFGVDLLWTPASLGVGLPLRGLPDTSERAVSLGAIGRRVMAKAVFRVRVAELEAAAPGVRPAVQDLVQVVGADAYAIVNEPLRADMLRTEWTLDCG